MDKVREGGRERGGGGRGRDRDCDRNRDHQNSQYNSASRPPTTGPNDIPTREEPARARDAAGMGTAEHDPELAGFFRELSSSVIEGKGNATILLAARRLVGYANRNNSDNKPITRAILQ